MTNFLVYGLQCRKKYSGVIYNSNKFEVLLKVLILDMKHEEMRVVGGNAFNDASKAFIDVILLLFSYDVIAMKLAKYIASRLPKNEKYFLFYLKSSFRSQDGHVEKTV